MRRIDFYTAAAPLAFIVGFVWVYVSMVFFKIPAWPAMVAMAGYYAVGGLACHERHDNASKSIKGLLLGSIASWIGVWVWTMYYKGNPVAMATVMGIIVVICVLITKWRFMGDYQFIAMPQAFLGATIFFGLFNTFMMAKGVSSDLLSDRCSPLLRRVARSLILPEFLPFSQSLLAFFWGFSTSKQRSMLLGFPNRRRK